MDLARAAHREALRDMQPPPVRPRVPGVAYDPTPINAPRDVIFGQLFALVSRCVRQTMLLEDRLAAGITHTRDTLLHTAPPTVPGAPTQAPPPKIGADRLFAERLEQERLEQHSPEGLENPPEEILADVHAVFDEARQAGLAPQAPASAPAKPQRRPIPVIPPGPEAPLTT